MNLEEAIKHANDVAKKKYAEAMLCHAKPVIDQRELSPSVYTDFWIVANKLKVIGSECLLGAYYLHIENE